MQHERQHRDIERKTKHMASGCAKTYKTHGHKQTKPMASDKLLAIFEKKTWETKKKKQGKDKDCDIEL